ncbi:hypothetical protein JKA74_09470 [Marivirga sp. S37H4]|uniref:Uncharacterized protein n=1 Tax=Marivirga aurantiaca TaxID=2802615 RepID=A0A934WY21_9BACT|nr:hypothetical protein [Marivirga aurantiaca]MBK6265268.1 hypothetical protein [Marivirga aurantiaca]
MFRLFAKIRNTNLNKQGLRKYFLYAAGEIFLIVISVLIAIQLNNLNESRKDNKLTINYKNLLIADFQKDITQLKKAKVRFSRELELIKSYEERLNSPLTTFDTLLHIAKTEFNPNIPPFVRYNATTLETMKATGDIGLLNKDLLNKINELQDLQNEEQYYQEITLQSHANLLEAYLLHYPIHAGLIKQGVLFEQSWEKVDFIDLSLRFNALLTIKMAALENALVYYSKIEVKTELLIDHLQ